MNHNYLLCTVLILVLLFYLCVCICPKDSTEEVIRCLYNITHGHNATNVLAGTDTLTIRHYCMSGYFNKSVECLVHLYQDCHASTELTSLRTIADPQTWRNGVTQLCNNIHLHAEYSACIVAQKRTVYECLQQNEYKFTETLQYTQTKKSITYNLCRYFKGVKVCTSVPVEKNCGKEIGFILAEFIKSLSPKFCFHTSSLANQITYSSFIVLAAHICSQLISVYIGGT